MDKLPPRNSEYKFNVLIDKSVAFIEEERSEIRRWLWINNIRYTVYAGKNGLYYRFVNEDDAALFKLTMAVNNGL